MAEAAVRSKAVVLLLLIVDSLLISTPIVGSCIDLCFVVRYFMSILALQLILMKKRELLA